MQRCIRDRVVVHEFSPAEWSVDIETPHLVTHVDCDMIMGTSLYQEEAGKERKKQKMEILTFLLLLGWSK